MSPQPGKQETGQRDDELYYDEYETWWVPAEGRSRWDARKVVHAVDGEPFIPISAYRVRVVRGRVGEQYGEPWFFCDPRGDRRFYEVVLDDD